MFFFRFQFEKQTIMYKFGVRKMRFKSLRLIKSTSKIFDFEKKTNKNGIASALIIPTYVKIEVDSTKQFLFHK